MPTTHYRRGRATGPSDLFIATPSGTGQPSANYQVSLADTFKKLGELGLTADYCLHVGDCHVDDARNSLIRVFLTSSEAPVMIFIDDDVGWNPDNLVKIIKAEGDIVAGAYPLKQDHEEYPVRVLPTLVQQARKDGLLEVEGVPTGFMAIKRYVIDAFVERKKWTRFKPRTNDGRGAQHVIFERTLVEGHRWSGDLNFCREARSLGFKVWCDPEMNFTHEGRKTWEGSFGDWYRRANNIPHPILIDGFNRLAEGEATAEVFERIFLGAGNPYSAGPRMINYCHQRASQAKTILEVGSGLTTIAMGMAAIKSGATIYTLEHDFDYWLQTRELVKRFKLRAVRLYHAQLKLIDDAHAWYDVPDDLPPTFDLCVCDGPPRKYGRNGLHLLLGDRIKDAEWVVDDVDDKRQLDLVKEHARGRDIEVVGNAHMRQFAVVRRTVT